MISRHDTYDVLCNGSPTSMTIRYEVLPKDICTRNLYIHLILQLDQCHSLHVQL